MLRNLEGLVLEVHQLLRQAGKEAMGQGDELGGCHISTNRNPGFLLKALETEKWPHGAGAAAVPGWPKQGTAGSCPWLRSPALDVCLLGSVGSTTLKSLQGFSGVNSLPVGSRKCFIPKVP